MRKNGHYSIIGSVAFKGNGVVRVIVSKDRSFSKGLFEHIKDFLTLQAPLPRVILAEEAG